MDNQEQLFEQEPRIASLISRLFASIIDGIILGIIGLLLGLFFSNTFIILSWKAKIIGFLITLVYFSIFNSKYFNGQTIGQKILGIRVVTKNGELLTLPNSIIRSLFLPIIILLNNWSLPIYSILPISLSIVGFMLFLVIILELYFIVFNRLTRQSLHDVVVKSYVIKDSRKGLPKIEENNRLVYLLSFIPIVLVIGFIVFTMVLAKTNSYKEIIDTQKNVSSIDKVYNATVFSGFTSSSMMGKSYDKVRFIKVSVYTNSKKISDESFQNTIAESILSSSISKDTDLLILILSSGYDIGIASSWKSKTISHTITEWKNNLGM